MKVLTANLTNIKIQIDNQQKIMQANLKFAVHLQ